MDDCVFCNIIENKIPCAKIWENENFLAFLDIRPVTKGMTLVVPKKHFNSYIFNENEEITIDLMRASKTVAKLLENAFKVKRVALVLEGAGVNHLHAKLYPMHGYNDNSSFETPKEAKYFENYQGYITTEFGPKTSIESLNEIAEFIKNVNKS